MKKTGGLLALLGLGAYAYYKYTKMSPKEKGEIKGKLDNVKKNLEVYTQDIKESVSKTVSQAKDNLGGLKKEAKSSANDLLNGTEDMYK